VDRPIGSTHFLVKYRSIQFFFHQLPPLYGKLGIYAPDFFHPLALSLISMSFISSRNSKMIICFVWFSIDSIFELGQKCGAELREYPPKWFVTLPIVKDIFNFFAHGTFDPYDLLAIALGSSAAFLILRLTSRKGGNNEHECSE
jgi:hypothetical protein